MRLDEELEELIMEASVVTGKNYLTRKMETIETDVLKNVVEDLIKQCIEVEDEYMKYVSLVDENYRLKNKLPVERD